MRLSLPEGEVKNATDLSDSREGIVSPIRENSFERMNLHIRRTLILATGRVKTAVGGLLN